MAANRERIARQLQPDRIRVLTEKDVQELRERASQARGASATAQAPATPDLSLPQACVEFGDFLGTEVARVEAALLQLGLGSRQTARPVEVPGWYMVYLPPYKTRPEAERAAVELSKRGVKELLVLGEGPLKLGISLGSFGDPELARAHAGAVEKLGVQNVRVSDKPESGHCHALPAARTRRRSRAAARLDPQGVSGTNRPAVQRRLTAHGTASEFSRLVRASQPLDDRLLKLRQQRPARS